MLYNVLFNGLSAVYSFLTWNKLLFKVQTGSFVVKNVF